MGRSHLALIALLLAAPAFAQEPVGCDKFKWPLDRERTMLANPTVVASGSRRAATACRSDDADARSLR